MKSLLPPLPALQAQEQGPDHGLHGVLMVGDQLGRQRRKRLMPAAADKSRNRNTFPLELRKQVNGRSPVGGNRSVAIGLATDRAAQPNERGKIDLAGKKKLLVFPNALKCVSKGKLNRSAPARREAGFGPLKPSALPPCGSLVILLRSILYLAISTSLISSVKLPCKFTTPLLHYIVRTNRGRLL